MSGFIVNKRKFSLPQILKITSVEEAEEAIVSILKVFQDIFNSLEEGVPVGQIVWWPTTSIPNGYYACDSSEKSRTVDKKLYNVIGVSYGSGDGTTTFNVPGCVYPDDIGGRWIIKK